MIVNKETCYRRDVGFHLFCHNNVFIIVLSMITLPDGETTLRLVDDAFVRICGAVNDLSMVTRALACSLLGGVQKVGQKFLQQTLDKKLMSNMRVRRIFIAHSYFSCKMK